MSHLKQITELKKIIPEEIGVLKKIQDTYKMLQGTGNTKYQNHFYYKQLKKYNKYNF